MVSTRLSRCSFLLIECENSQHFDEGVGLFLEGSLAIETCTPDLWNN